MNWRRSHVWRLLLLLLLGQVVSLNLAVISFSSSLLSNLGVHTPLTQAFIGYSSLALVYTPILLSRCQKITVLWYWYALVGFFDILGIYLIVKAYQYTSLTSVNLLDSWTIPLVMILTWTFLGTQYSLGQFVGAAVCIGGLGLALLSDINESNSGGKNPILGDLLVICGTIGHSISNVGQEFLVKKRDRVEFLSMLSLFAVIITLPQICIFERENLEAIKWTPEIVSLFTAFALSFLLYYSLMPFVVKMSGAALLNLSILTTNVWSVIIRLFFYRQKLDLLYFAAFAIVAVGLIIYSVADGDPRAATETEVGDTNIEYQKLEEHGNDVISISKHEESEQMALLV